MQSFSIPKVVVLINRFRYLVSKTNQEALNYKYKWG